MPVTGKIPTGRLSGVRALLAAALLTAIAFAVRLAMTPLLDSTAPVVTFLPAIVASTWLGGSRAGIFSTMSGAILALLIFTPPYQSLIPATTESAIAILLYLVAGLLCTTLVEGYRRSRARLTDVLESVDDGLLALDPHWRLSLVNARASAFTGEGKAILTGKLFWDEFPAFRAADAEAAFRLAMTGRVASRTEIHDSERQRWLEARVFPAVDGGLTVYLTDITERRQSEEKLSRARRQTEHVLNSIQEIAMAADVTGRDQVETTLRASEARHRFLAEEIPQLVWTRAPDGPIDYVNRHWTTYTGLSLDETREGKWLELVHPDDRPALVAAIGQRREGELVPFEFRLRRDSDRDWRWHLGREQYLRDQSGEFHWIGTAVDIDGRKQAEAAIRASEQRYSTLASAMPALIWSAGEREHNAWFSHQWTEYTGQPTSGSIEENWLLHVHPDDRSECFRAWQNSLLAGIPFEQEFRIQRRDGMYRWFLGRALPVCNEVGEMQWIGTCTDIDDRRRAEEAQRRTNQTLSAFIEACPLSVTVLDGDGTVRLWNPAAEQLFGWTEEQAAGNYNPAIPAALRDEYAEQLRQVLSGHPVLGAEAVRLRRDGTTFVGQWWTAALTDSGGRAQLISIIADATERRRAEAAIREAEQRFRTLVDQAPVLMWIADSESRFQWFSKSWHDFTGRTPQQEQGVGWMEGMHPEDRQGWDDGYSQSFARRDAFGMEYRLQRHDGEFRWILGRGVPLLAPDGNFTGYIGSCVDITERRHMETALRESEDRLRTALNAAQMATWEWDVTTGKVIWSEGRRAMSGGANPDDYEAAIGTVHPDDRPRVEAAVAGSVGMGLPYEAEYRFVQPDGAVRWILTRGHVVRGDSGAVTRLTGVALDVTERRQADQAMRDGEERLRLAQEAAELGIWDWNLLTGATTWTVEIFGFLGIEPGSVQPTVDLWNSFIHPDDRQPAIAAAARAVETGEPLVTEFRVVRPDGTMRWLLTLGRPVYDEARKAVRLIGVNLDVTGRRETEEKLRRTNAELEQYAFAASHDLQEPLRTVMLYSQLLTRRYGGLFDAQAQRYFENISTSAARMQTLIEDLLSYSRILSESDREFVAADMNSVLREATEVCRAAVDENDCIVGNDGLPVVHGDYDALVSVLRNLISNAVKYRRKDRIPIIQVHADREDGYWHFTVKDNGIGIKPVYHTRIFGVFKRLHGREVPGTGIGLAICKRTVEQHGGRIWVESEEGTGATFHFTLPATGGDAEGNGSARK